MGARFNNPSQPIMSKRFETGLIYALLFALTCVSVYHISTPALPVSRVWWVLLSQALTICYSIIPRKHRWVSLAFAVVALVLLASSVALNVYYTPEKRNPGIQIDPRDLKGIDDRFPSGHDKASSPPKQ
jgi:hypothetical protein